HRVFGFVFGTEFVPSWFFLGLVGHDMVRLKALETCILKEDTTRRKRIAFLITNTFIVDASSKGLTQVAHQPLFNVNDEVGFHRMRFFCHYTSLVVLWHQ